MAVLKYKDPQGNWQTLDTGSGSVSSVEITSLPYGSEPTARITAGVLYIGWPDGVPVDSVITDESNNPVTSAAIYQALQQTPGMAPVQSVNNKTGAVVLDAQDVGAYEKPATGIPASDLADGVIPDVPVTDVQVNGVSVLQDGVANVPIMSADVKGVAKLGNSNGLYGLIVSDGSLMVNGADDYAIKTGSGKRKPITSENQHKSAFYGLCKAAGADMASSSNPVGTYTDAAKVAIQKMLGIYEAPFRLIYDNTITEETGAINIISDMDSNPFLLKEILVLFDGVVGTATGSGSVIVNSSTADNNSANLTVANLYNTTAQTRSAHIQIIGGRMFGEAENANLPNFYSANTLQHNKNASGWIECNLVNEITIVSLNGHKFTAGNIKIYGR